MPPAAPDFSGSTTSTTDTTRDIGEQLALADRGCDVVEPTLPLVAAALPESEFDALREAGWKVSRTAAGELRVVCMPHVTRDALKGFVGDLDRIRA